MVTPRISADHVTIRILHWLANRNPLPAPALPPDHILLLGCGERGTPVLEWLLARNQPVVVVDDEAAVIERVRAAGAIAIYGDAANPAILKSAGAENARLIIATLKRLAHNPAFLACADKTPVLISLFEPELADRIAAHGGTAILESFAAADDFNAWFAEQFPV
jgi:nucleoside-diphosphate-sugar epimerase